MKQFFKVLKKDKNPYIEGTPAWNCYIDICCSMNDQTSVVSIDDMILQHKMTSEYYETYLSELINDRGTGITGCS